MTLDVEVWKILGAGGMCFVLAYIIAKFSYNKEMKILETNKTLELERVKAEKREQDIQREKELAQIKNNSNLQEQFIQIMREDKNNLYDNIDKLCTKIDKLADTVNIVVNKDDKHSTRLDAICFAIDNINNKIDTIMTQITLIHERTTNCGNSENKKEEN
jgi:hypothetical protein